MIPGVERHGPRQVQPQINRQARALSLDLTGISQAAQSLHQRLLFSAQTGLLSLVPLIGVNRHIAVFVVQAIGCLRDVFQPGDGLPEAIDLKVETAFRQLRE